MARGLLENGKPPRNVAKGFGVDRSTLYRAIGGMTTGAATQEEKR